MTKNEIIAEITAFYTFVGSPFRSKRNDNNIPTTINHYSMLVYETGNSEKSIKPVVNSKYVDFVVYNEGVGGEAAYYLLNESKNDVDNNVVGTDTLISISKIYESTEIRKRIRSAIIIAANSIFSEAVPVSTLTSNANANQKDVAVTDGSIFVVGQNITIADSAASESNIIASISSNTLTMVTNLVNTYLTTRDAYVAALNNSDRRSWAAKALLNPDEYTLAMTSFDASVQSSGNLVTDSVLQGIVDDNVTKLGSADRIV
ncbi:MAG: hypothetical protein PHF86_09820 [Candidatus Nanoarchaeia archaeon]|nr:hypothetical protein [Candidatus Nanoarchaeia archaeon]